MMHGPKLRASPSVESITHSGTRTARKIPAGSNSLNIRHGSAIAPGATDGP
jgi:hypothetical protein